MPQTALLGPSLKEYQWFFVGFNSARKPEKSFLKTVNRHLNSSNIYGGGSLGRLVERSTVF